MALLQPTAYANCSLQSLPFPALPGAKFESLEAISTFKNRQLIPAGIYSNNGPVTASNLQFCNVTISYTPAGLTTKTTVQMYLPLKWNGRMQAIGGSGWTAGLTDVTSWGMIGMAAQGYAAITTNGGIVNPDKPSAWAFARPGQIDMAKLEHYASRSLLDLSLIGKALARSFYGSAPARSYWNGCSQGGRQGLMLAQKYPTAFDGIIASAPAVNWSPLLASGFWAQALMNEMGAYPDGCQLGALTAGAVRHCDPKDGVADGMISDPDSCDFDPYTMVGASTYCFGVGWVNITREAARVAHTGWYGLMSSRHPVLHHGSTHEAPVATQGMPVIGSTLYSMGYTEGLADVVCSPDRSKCRGKPHPIVEAWIRVFVLKDPSYNSSSIGLKMLDDVLERSVKEYTEVMSTNSPDLSAFRKAGGKLLQYHGLVRDLTSRLDILLTSLGRPSHTF
jgi:feruloyl esterase